MLEHALRDEPGLYVSPIESRIPGKSYTIDTIRRIKSELGDDVSSLCLILGTDTLRGLSQWKECDKLVNEVDIIPVARAGDNNPFEDPHVLSTLEGNFGEACVATMKGAMVSGLPAPMSASEVRSGLHEGRDVREMIAPEVLTYIERRGLYKENVASLSTATPPL
jgi:nicotinate-nucleotide adenylyltransferase